MLNEVSDEPVRNRSNDDRNDSGGRSTPMSGGRLMPMSGRRVVLRDDDDSCTTMGNKNHHHHHEVLPFCLTDIGINLPPESFLSSLKLKQTLQY